jgi:hypothetical protein
MPGRNKKVYEIVLENIMERVNLREEKEDFRSDLSRNISNIFWHYSLLFCSVKKQRCAGLYILLLCD